MELWNKSPYGWGGFRIPMPRSATDIYADRRRNRGIHKGMERRRDLFVKPFPLMLSDFLRNDLPLPKTSAAVSFGLGMVVLLSLAGLLVPPLEDEVPARVEITARLFEEQLTPPKIAQPVPRDVPPAVAKTLPPKPVQAPIPPPEAVAPALTKEPPPVPAPPVRIVERVYPRPEPAIKAPARMRNYEPEPARVAALPENRSFQKMKTASQSQPVKAGLPKKDYTFGESSGRAGLPAATNQRSSFAAGTTVNLPATSGLVSDYGRPVSQGDSAAPLTGRSFAPDRSSDQVSLRGSSGPGAGYRQPVNGSPDLSRIPATGEGVGGLGGRATSTVDIPGLGQRKTVSGGDLKQNLPASAGLPNSKIALGGAGDLDPNLFVSLNQLKACIDQSREDQLRTQLATMLETKGQCRSGNMIFKFDFPETGYTIQVGIYNPTDFSDKCAALTAAIECVHHSK
ncbi:MAG: hypothetical protein R2940_05190 [Syntrophotaleaceae bacterium]